MSNKRLIKSGSLISFATLCSRVFGFVRDILIANFFGTTMLAESFVVAFRIPNLLRDLVGEGAANAAFVPVLTEYHTTRTKSEFWHLARNLFYILSAVLFVISVIGVLFAPVIVRAIAPGFIESPEKLAITINLARLMFPFIFLVGLVAYGMGVLNSLNNFTVNALSPIILNISMILFLVFVCHSMGIKGLAISVLVGGVLQVFMVIMILRAKGLRFLPDPSEIGKKLKQEIGLLHPAIKRIWKLLIPRFFGSAVYQMSVIVDNIFSTFGWIVGVGAPAALWYSYRLFHLPLAIFGIAIATVALPKMSKEVAIKDIKSLKSTINFSMRSVFLILVPAGVGLALLGKPIIRILFERGEFTEYSTYITHSALFYYSFGLFACGGIKILVNSFFSLGDTKTPVKVASVSFIINLVLNFILMWPLKLGGLALATSIAATANFIMLYIMLNKKIGDVGGAKILNSFTRIALSSFCMAIFAYFAGNFLSGIDKGIVINVVYLLLAILVSVIIFIISCFVFRVEELKGFIRWILKRG